MQRSKNDQRDALVLGEFAARMPFKPWVRPKPNTLALWAIARRLEALTALCTAEKNRRYPAGLSQAIPTSVWRDLARSLRFHDQARKQLRQEALQCIAAGTQLQRQYRLVQSMSGIGETSALQLLAELALLPEDRDVRQWVAYAGLDPRERRSGTSVHQYTRISKVGNRHLRQALSMPALVASRREPHLRGFYEHLLARGKRKRQALVPVVRKLLHATRYRLPLPHPRPHKRLEFEERICDIVPYPDYVALMMANSTRWRMGSMRSARTRTLSPRCHSSGRGLAPRPASEPFAAWPPSPRRSAAEAWRRDEADATLRLDPARATMAWSRSR